MRPSARHLASVLALTAVVAGVTVLGSGARALGQLPPSEDRLKILTDPESVKKKAEKDRTRPPLELSRTQVAPFDILPFVKPNHWSTVTLDLLANYDDFSGELQTSPVAMARLPQEIIYRREARLAKTQRSRLSVQMILPAIPKEIGLELTHGDGARPVESWPARLSQLEPHQMLVVFLTKEPGDSYALWNRYQAVGPRAAERNDAQVFEKERYYRFVNPLDPEHPALSPHPLTWTTISHIVWDGMLPDTLSPAQQQAMLDWLHWGGQLILVGGAGPGFSFLKDSFLFPYLPAEATGENALLASDDLKPLSAEYPPPYVPSDKGLDDGGATYSPDPAQTLARRYLPPAPIVPRADRPVFLAGLKPREGDGVRAIPLGESATRLLAVERRVGRGRVTMLAFNPTDPAIATWPGFDTFLRRVILRRPEERAESRLTWDSTRYAPPRFGPLPGPDLTWVRYLARDLGGPVEPPKPVEEDPNATSQGATTAPSAPAVNSRMFPPNNPGFAAEPPKPPELSVADWNDASLLPRTCRQALEESSGIKIPHASFVLKVILAYILALVPLNWLICRYLFHRRELAWLVVPVLSLAFAFGVERAAAYNLGYDTACDEIDVLEAYGDYPRALLSRFASLYSSGRTRFSVTYPNAPTALVLPLDNGRSLRGEDVSTSVFQSFPVPGLIDYLVQPRSLSFFRAEQFSTLEGAISLVTEGGPRRVVNGTSLTLRDAVIVDNSSWENGHQHPVYMGSIAPGGSVEVKPAQIPEPSPAQPGALEPWALLGTLTATWEDRPENAGEIRLVAWVDRPAGGQTIQPAVDRHRGFTVVVVHLRNGPSPAPEGPVYDARKTASEPIPPAVPAFMDPALESRGSFRQPAGARPAPGSPPILTPAPRRGSR